MVGTGGWDRGNGPLSRYDLMALASATHATMIPAPAMPAGESVSLSRRNENTAVITGQRLWISATDLSEIFVRARFCSRYPKNVHIRARYKMIAQARDVVASR